jgi:hypothetical protein
VAPFPFEQIYGGWFRRNIAADARQALARSVDRYVSAIGAAAHGA